MKPSYYLSRSFDKRLWAALCLAGCLLALPVMFLAAMAKMPVVAIGCAVGSVFLAFLAAVHTKDASRLEDLATVEESLVRREELGR